MGRFVRGIPKSSDIVHLGRRGISKFCANIKESIVHIKKLRVLLVALRILRAHRDLVEDQVITVQQL